MRSALSILMFLLAAPPLTAQDATVRLSLSDALARARENSPHLSELTAQQAAAEAALRGAQAEKRPLVDLSAGYTRNSHVDEFRLALPGQPSRVLFPDIPNNYRLHAGASVPLWTGGRIESAVAAADRQREAAGLDVTGAEHDLDLETRTAYWRLVTARESERVLAEALTAYEAHLTDANNRFKFGVAARNEVLAVQVERDRAELSRLQAENAANISEADLLRLMGLPAGTHLDPTDPANPTDRSDEKLEDLTTLATTAEQARPELKALEARIAAARAAVGIQKAASKPQAFASLGYDYADPNQRIVPQRDEFRGTWSAGVTVSLRAFDGGRTAAAAAEASARADALERELADRRQRLRLEVTSRLLDVRTARAALAVTGRNLISARENVKVAKDRYREGVIPSTELLDAETNLLRAGLDQTAAATQLRVALANLEHTVGVGEGNRSGGHPEGEGRAGRIWSGETSALPDPSASRQAKPWTGGLAREP
jgi:outer membrane protein TolC